MNWPAAILIVVFTTVVATKYSGKNWALILMGSIFGGFWGWVAGGGELWSFAIMTILFGVGVAEVDA